MDALNYESSKFKQHLNKLQDQFECLGIKCYQVGNSKFLTDSWPECEEYPENLKIAGYFPPSGSSIQISKMDIDVSTILMFVMMEANDAAMYIYKHGHNMKDSETAS